MSALIELTKTERPAPSSGVAYSPHAFLMLIRKRVVAFPCASPAQRPSITNDFPMEVDAFAALSADGALALVSRQVFGADLYMDILKLK